MDDFDLDSMVDRCLGVPPIHDMPSGGISASPSAPPSHYDSRVKLVDGTPMRDHQQSEYFSAPQSRLSVANVYGRAAPTPSAAHSRNSPGKYTSAENFSASRFRPAPEAHQPLHQGGGSDGPLEIQSGGILTGRSYESPSASARQDPTLRRIQLWAERKDAKRAVLVYERLQEELSHCTFRPYRETTQISEASSQHLAPSSLYKDNKAWGYDEFVDRLVTAREHKATKEEEDERRKSGATGSHWHPGTTVPEPFEFNRYNRRPIAALKSHFEDIAPQLRDEHEQTLSTIEAPSIPPGLFSVRPSHVIVGHATPDRVR